MEEKKRTPRFYTSLTPIPTFNPAPLFGAGGSPGVFSMFFGGVQEMKEMKEMKNQGIIFGASSMPQVEISGEDPGLLEIFSTMGAVAGGGTGLMSGTSRQKTKNYNQDNMEIMASHLRTFIVAPEIKEELIKVAIDIWVRPGNQKLPTLEQLVNFHLNSQHRGCIFNFTAPRPGLSELYKRMIGHSVVAFGEFIPCAWYGVFLEFHDLERRLPSKEEFVKYLDTVNRVFNVNDGEEEKSGKKPTANLEKLVAHDYLAKTATKPGEVDCCGICQENFKPADKCHTLQPCGHMFHPPGDGCLGVIDWLKDHDTCPICRGKVVLS